MCWRDDVVKERFCTGCGSYYYGDLGHRGCPGRPKQKAPAKKAPKKTRSQKKK